MSKHQVGDLVYYKSNQFDTDNGYYNDIGIILEIKGGEYYVKWLNMNNDTSGAPIDGLVPFISKEIDEMKRDLNHEQQTSSR